MYTFLEVIGHLDNSNWIVLMVECNKVTRHFDISINYDIVCDNTLQTLTEVTFSIHRTSYNPFYYKHLHPYFHLAQTQWYHSKGKWQLKLVVIYLYNILVDQLSWHEPALWVTLTQRPFQHGFCPSPNHLPKLSLVYRDTWIPPSDLSVWLITL